MSDQNLPKDIKEQALKTFKKYDLDNSGFIELKELKILMTDISKEIDIPEPTDEEITQVLSDTDQNDDKKISTDEFIELFKIIFIMKNMN